MNLDLIPLDSQYLERLSQRATVPQYNRKLIPGIVHIGVGGFNRSHLAVYLDDLLCRKDSMHWGECGIGLLPSDKVIHAALASQGNLYSLLTRDAEQTKLRVVGSIVEHLYAPEAHETVLNRMSSPECAIVSLTVTEGGYFIEDASGTFLEQHPDIQFDLANPDQPRTFLGYLAGAADRRMKHGIKPFTIMSCDNLQGNGAVARKALLSFAEMRSPELRRWIEQYVSFPNSMVDRITPHTTEEDRSFIREHFGVSDLSPVVSEPFRQWVIEDSFSNTRPQWDLVGAQLTSDVKPFELIKMRVLNGGHSTLAYVAAQIGHTYVSQAVENPLIHTLLEHFMEEVTDTLPQLPGMDLTEYKTTVLHRFSNPIICDQILRICSEGSAKIAKFIVPTVRDLFAMGRKPVILSFVIASWLYSMRGINEDGQKTQIVDSSAHLFAGFIATGASNARTALSVNSVFGDLGASESPLAPMVQRWLDDLHSIGVRASITHAVTA